MTHTRWLLLLAGLLAARLGRFSATATVHRVPAHRGDVRGVLTGGARVTWVRAAFVPANHPAARCLPAAPVRAPCVPACRVAGRRRR